MLYLINYKKDLQKNYKEKKMKNIAQKIKKDWKFFSILAVAVILIWMLVFYSLDVSDKVYNTSEKIEAEGSIKDVTPGMKIEQKIKATRNNFKRVDIQFEPLKEQNNIAGKVTIGINDEKQQPKRQLQETILEKIMYMNLTLKIKKNPKIKNMYYGYSLKK